MASHHTIAIFAACFAVLVMVVAVQGDMPAMPGMVATPAPGVVAPPTSAPSPNGSTSNLTYSSMVIGLVASFIVTFLVVKEGLWGLSYSPAVCLGSLVLLVLWFLLSGYLPFHLQSSLLLLFFFFFFFSFFKCKIWWDPRIHVCFLLLMMSYN